MRRQAAALTLAITLCAMASPLRAQLEATERVRLIQDERRRALSPDDYLQLPGVRQAQTDVAGWATLTVIDLRNDDHQDARPDLVQMLVLQDYRAYLKQTWESGLRGYLRVRSLDFNVSTARGVPPPDTRRQEGFEIDLAYLEKEVVSGWNLRVGRQFVRAGRGLSLSADLDAINVDGTHGRWRHQVMGGTTIRRDPSVDTSIVGFDRGLKERDFALGSTRYRFDSGTEVSGYFLVERDRSRSLNPAQQVRPFRTDAEFLALGATGRLHPLMQYFLEAIRQTGRTLADVPGDVRVPIEAYALLGGLLYYPRSPLNPLVTLEYGFGSGDPARGSVTNAFGGKQTATTDTNFLYFGAFDGGLALSPRLSNLHALRVGAQIKPLPRADRRLPELLVGAKVSQYLKADVDGVISDPLASLATANVGQGLDVFTAYRPLSDLSFLVQYGRFQPGGSYPVGADDASSRVLATTTVSF